MLVPINWQTRMQHIITTETCLQRITLTYLPVPYLYSGPFVLLVRHRDCSTHFGLLYLVEFGAI